MRVYRVNSDVNRYQYFLPEHEEDALQLMTDCTPMSTVWSPPPVFVFKPLHEAGDFYQFSAGSLITSPRATEVLRTYLEMAGELLPLPFAGQTYTLLNVTECINCLDHERSEWVCAEDGTCLYPDRYVFHRNRFSESPIFKVPETRGGEILVAEGLHDPEDEFRYEVVRAGLKGLIFTELWSDEQCIDG